jgi:hypothetical protein
MRAIIAIAVILFATQYAVAATATHDCSSWGKANRCHAVWVAKAKMCVCR